MEVNMEKKKNLGYIEKEKHSPTATPPTPHQSPTLFPPSQRPPPQVFCTASQHQRWSAPRERTHPTRRKAWHLR